MTGPDAATRATWGLRPAAAPARAGDRSKMRLISWKPLVKNSLRGFAAIELPIGLKIHDVAIFVGRNGPWARLPSKPQIDRQGRRKTDAKGKAAYVPVLEWKTRDLADQFSSAVVALVRAAHPGALADEGQV